MSYEYIKAKKGDKFTILKKTQYEKLPVDEGIYEVVWVQKETGYERLFAVRMYDSWGTIYDEMSHFRADKFNKLLAEGYIVLTSA